MTNDDTIYMAGKKANESNNAAQQPVDNESGNTWKVVSLGGFLCLCASWRSCRC